MALLKKRFAGKGDDKLAEELEEARQRRRGYMREHQNRLREGAADRVDELIRQADEQLKMMLAEGAGSGQGFSLQASMPGVPSLTRLAELWVIVNDAGFRTALHRAIQDGSGYSELSRDQFEKEVARFDEEIAAREVELERRAAERHLEEARAEIAATEKRLATIEKG